jgi:hypothetical protein
LHSPTIPRGMLKVMSAVTCGVSTLTTLGVAVQVKFESKL